MKDERGVGNQPEDFTDRIESVNEDDAFLTALSRGQDPSGGQDPLAAAFLSLKAEVDAPMPAVPQIAEQSAGAVKPARPWLHGLVGAAAATVVIAGAGAIFYNTNTFAPSKDEAQVVELASTLEEMEEKASQGDMDAMRSLLGEALGIINQLKESPEEGDVPSNSNETSTSVVTVTEDPEQPEPAAPAAPEAPRKTAPERITVTERVTVTETVERERPTTPSSSAEPTPAPASQAADSAAAAQ